MTDEGADKRSDKKKEELQVCKEDRLGGGRVLVKMRMRMKAKEREEGRGRRRK